VLIYLVQYFLDPDAPIETGFILVGIMAWILFSNNIVTNTILRKSFLVFGVGKCVAMRMLFEKMIRLPIYSDEDFGKLINMATSDVEFIEWGAMCGVLFGIPMAFFLSFFFLIPIIGWISVITIVLC
jgi:hypothetical protein